MQTEYTPDILLDLITSRHSKRAYLSKSIPTTLLRKILKAAQDAPSSKNMQCWKVAVISGSMRDKMSDAMCKAFDSGNFGRADYSYAKAPIDDELMSRARACGYSLYKLKGIQKDDKTARLSHARENFTFFNAPTQMIFHLPSYANHGMFLDIGLFIQTVMLALKSAGLDSCPQYSIARYPNIVRELLGIGDRLVVCGLSVGYADTNALVNTFVPDRLSIDKYADWYY